MTTEYKLRIKDLNGDLQAEVTDFLHLAYVREVNAPGLLSFNLNGDHEAVNYLTENAQVEVWRRDVPNKIEWYVDFYGIQKDVIRFHEGKKKLAAFECPGQMSMLSWRINAWTAGYANRSSFEDKKAEYIMREIVRNNVTPQATVASGREREGEIGVYSITVDTYEDRGNQLYYYCAYKNVLEALQEIAEIGGGDFDVVKTSNTTWKFRYYDGQLGTDRSATVLFSLNRGNMANPIYSKFSAERKTAAVVAGQGEGANRNITITTGNDYEVTLRNYEMFVDARDLNDIGTALTDRGQSELAELKEDEKLEFDVLQTPSSIYAKHYFLGDLVKATYLDVTLTPKIQSVSITLDENKIEIIDIGMKTI